MRKITHTKESHPLSGKYISVGMVIHPHALRVVFAKLSIVKIPGGEQVATFAVLLASSPLADVFVSLWG